MQPDSGLSTADTKARLSKYGSNAIVEKQQSCCARCSATEDAISYNEWSFAMQQQLSTAQIKTSADPQPVRIGVDTVGKTITAVKITGQGNNLVLDVSAFYSPTQLGVYPIVLATYEIVLLEIP